jgi:hypothetical protein
MPCALQEWVTNLTVMQQSVLIATVRGPDTIRKDHVAKLLLRWYRRCVLISAFDRKVLTLPYDPGERRGGSFTGASIPPPYQDIEYADTLQYWTTEMNKLVDAYLRCTDELPHHYQLHFMHAVEILGYKHPDLVIQAWWCKVYRRLVNDAHLRPESEEDMDTRLGDNQKSWRAREEVVAKGPGA